jgi:isoleucyl-tRNA synthetase
VTSIALRKEAPFRTLKTHGIILDEGNNKMSKSNSSQLIDPEDLIQGTEKLDG